MSGRVITGWSLLAAGTGARDCEEEAKRVVRAAVVLKALERLELLIDDGVESRPWEKVWTGVNFATARMYHRAIAELRADAERDVGRPTGRGGRRSCGVGTGARSRNTTSGCVQSGARWSAR